MYPKTMILKAGKNNPRLPICRGNNGAGPGVHLLPPVKGAIPFPGATWRIGQEVKTPPFHGGNTGSIPVCVTSPKGQHYSSFFFSLERFQAIKPPETPENIGPCQKA